MFLYVIRNIRDGKEYVGTTTRSLSLRMNDHRYRSQAGRRESPLYEAIRKDGIESFEMKPIGKAASYEELLEMEQAEIQERNTLYPHGYNLVKGGRGNFGWQMKPETRAKIAAKATGRVGPWSGKKMSAEARANIAAAQRARRVRESASGMTQKPWNKGVKATPEHRAALLAARGEQWIERQRASRVGKPMSEETKLKIAESMRTLRNKRFWTSRKQTAPGVGPQASEDRPPCVE